MKIITSPLEFKKWRHEIAQTSPSKTIGFVPTMGALHEGHATLLRQARSENDLCVLSIFVNPTQFNDPKDLEKYPRTFENDCMLATGLNVDVIFAPEFAQMYPDNYRYKVIEQEFSKDLCGKDRPGHFDGVLSVVMKLFNVVEPHKAYFGEKDYQQLQLIRDMAKAFFLNVDVIPVATVREYDGLAMSSRNVRLGKDEREKAPQIYKIISSSQSADHARMRLSEIGYSVDYVVDKYDRRFVAVRTQGTNGEVRLIDNVSLSTANHNTAEANT